MNKENEIVLFETKDRSIKLPVALENEMVWLTANQMAQLFGRDEKTIRKHINNVFLKAKSIKITTRKKCVLM
ncbi:MAG: phosphoribosylaminoimidazolesuccinocarboxamide synthase, partial [Lachnospiraceae bacterium]|nr:phosphoribosylaminoimidazolesuccinocarboxamide synthase [Lachnospiraceae bacterium]